MLCWWWPTRIHFIDTAKICVWLLVPLSNACRECSRGDFASMSFFISALPSRFLFLCADIFIDFYKLTVSNIQHSLRTRAALHTGSPMPMPKPKRQREFIAFYGISTSAILWVLHRCEPMRLCMRISATDAATTIFNITNVLWVYRRRCRHFVSLYDLPFGAKKIHKNKTNSLQKRSREK